MIINWKGYYELKYLVSNLIYTRLFLFQLFVISAYFMFKTCDKPGNSIIIFQLSIGYIVSCIFYFIVVWLPEYGLKQKLKRHLEDQHEQLKAAIRENIVLGMDKWTPDVDYISMTTTEFREHFLYKNSIYRNEWTRNFYKNFENSYKHNMIHKIMKFEKEVDFVQHKLNIHNEYLFKFLRAISNVSHHFEGSGTEINADKLADFIWIYFIGHRDDKIEFWIKNI
jgi:hypothetical protein